ncbi:MAG: hypothetical protein RMX68_017545 [Aulosira sp. ZfuVER01]|nr:hypothetical protein [Aulosira sp. ZfuVER01]MDZ7996321.1 hypothetical protein [Aulosira sp. DedVER01a]MDZ8055771.1 hypothetical protein [Aulosira sp. ZfuCHP01]
MHQKIVDAVPLRKIYLYQGFVNWYQLQVDATQLHHCGCDRL